MFKGNSIPIPQQQSHHSQTTILVAFLGNDFPNKSDKHLRRIQATTMAAADPLITLWSNLIEQDMGKGSGTLAPVEDVLDTVQHTLSLLVTGCVEM